MRATLRLSSPAPLASPITMSSIAWGSSEGMEWRSSPNVRARRSSGRIPDRPPRFLPKTVRLAAAIVGRVGAMCRIIADRQGHALSRSLQEVVA